MTRLPGRSSGECVNRHTKYKLTLKKVTEDAYKFINILASTGCICIPARQKEFSHVEFEKNDKGPKYPCAEHTRSSSLHECLIYSIWNIFRRRVCVQDLKAGTYGRASWATKSILCFSRKSIVITHGASWITSSTHLPLPGPSFSQTFTQTTQNWTHSIHKFLFWKIVNF